MNLKINLGCGRKYLPGFVNCDLNKNVKVDECFDLESFPYPFESGLADEILMDNVLEHLDNIPKVMEELHRILKPGGIARIIVPYAKSDWALQDPTHKHFFTERSMEYFSAHSEFNFYANCRFNIIRAKLTVGNDTWRHMLRNMIPFRNSLRYFFYNLYDGVTFELQKV